MNQNNKYSGLCFWSWNGEMVEDEIKAQIREFKSQNLGGFFIHARAGLKIPYIGDEWLNAVSCAIKEAKKCGLDVWLYDENGWPSGFGGGEVLKHGSMYQQKILRWKFVDDGFSINDSCIALFKVCDQGFEKVCYCNETNKIESNKKFDSSYLYFYYEINPFYSDLLNPDAVKCFIENTHEVYYKYFGDEFGNTIKGIFTDEPQLTLGRIPWTSGLESYFSSVYGYSLIDKLPYLVLEIEGYHKVRHDFWKAVSNIFVNSFTKQIYDWCSAHGILLTGHFGSEDGLCDQLSSNAGVMPHYEYMHIPGIDHLGKRITSPVLVKQVASAANQMGKKLVLSETFGCGGWNMSFKDMAWVWGWQALHGINLPCLHLSAYSIKGCRKRDYPPVFSYHEPWWDEFKTLSGYLNNLNSCISWGERELNTLVIHPMSSMWCEGFTVHSDRMKSISKEFRALSDNLIHLHWDFEYGDEIIMEKHARVENKSIFIKDREYSLVILPYALSIEQSTLRLITEYVHNGGKLLIINSLPKMVEGVRNDTVSTLLSHENVSVVANRRDILKKAKGILGINNKIKVLYSNSGDMAEEILIHIRREGNKSIVFMWNKSMNSTINTRLVINERVGVKQIDLVSTDKKPVKSAYLNNITTCSLSFHPGQIIVLELEGDAECDQLPECIVKKIEVINSPWKVEALDVNSLTIDYARYRFDGESWSEIMPLIRIQDEVYEKLGELQRDCTVTIRYEVETEFDNIPDNLSLVLESEGYSDVRINGSTIKQCSQEWWIDRSFKKTPIYGHVFNGVNSVEVDYPLTYWKAKVNVEEVFETERNKFFYPVEFENVYIVGDMDVALHGEIVYECPAYTTVKPERFVLKNLTPKSTYGSFTDQNLWFYRGGVSLTAEVQVDESADTVILELQDPCCMYIKLFVNNEFVDLLFLPPYQADITKHLVKGLNNIRMEVMGSNRNLLGPHHHVKGEFGFVGPSSFKGRKGWEDFLHPEVDNSTWTDTYSFVPTGLSKPPMLIYKSRR